MDSDETLKRYSDLEVAGKEHEGKEKEYPEIAMEIGKFVREVGRGMWHCSVHHVPVSPIIRVCLYTLDGHFIGAQSFASSCFGDTAPDKVTKAVVKEIGSYCAGAATTCILIGFTANPGFWVALAVGVAGAAASVTYSWVVNLAWKLSAQHDFLSPMDPVFATPNIEGSEYIKKYHGAFEKVRTKRDHLGKFGMWGDALPEEFFVGRPATIENHVGITSNDFGSGFKWLIKLK